MFTMSELYFLMLHLCCHIDEYVSSSAVLWRCRAFALLSTEKRRQMDSCMSFIESISSLALVHPHHHQLQGMPVQLKAAI